MKRTISIKLGLLIGILLMLILVVGLTAFFQTYRINQKVKEIADVEHRTSETTYEMQINQMGIYSAVLKYMRDPDPEHPAVIREGERKFALFQQEYRSLEQTEQIKKLGVNAERTQKTSSELARVLIKKQDEQNTRLDSLRIEAGALSAILEDATYEPERRFEIHKDKKMRASLKVQAMKVNVNELIESIENYLRTHKPEYENEMAAERERFLSNFNAHQQIALPERKEKFAKEIKKPFNQMMLLMESIIANEKNKEELLRVFEVTQNEFLTLLDEQILIIANRNLIRAKEDTLETAKTSNAIIGFLLIFILLFGIITGIILSRSITRPLKQLMEATRVIAQNDFSHRVNIQTDDELSVLGNSFNQMTEQLRQSTEKQIALHAALEKSNNELKDFAHVVSHDLKAPLRGIYSLSEWLADGKAEKTKDKERQQLALLTGRVKRMFDMIDGILKYSKAGTEAERKENIDINEMLNNLVVFLSFPSHIEVKIQEGMPSIVFDKIRLLQIFQNLMNNAAKYNDKERGLIQINFTDEGDYWKFSVADNGSGIEEKFFQKIFNLFQTVNPIDEKESTGIGLAIVKKIIENADGKIWVESTINEGSTFFFTLPKNSENRA